MMHLIGRLVYRCYQLLVALPLLLCVSGLTAILTTLGCTLGGAAFWSYYPPMIWSRLMCWGMLLPVRVKGREHLSPHASYVFVANHQGAYDIFLVYGFIGRNFKWMMKKELRRMPLIGKACQSAGHIFVDKSGPKAVQHTYDQARKVLRGGTSVVVFPEGARSFTGHMGVFRRGAFQLADELQLPVVPVTIDGSFDVLPRQRGFYFLNWHPLRLTIHKPIYPCGKGSENVKHTLAESYRTIMDSLPSRYSGFVENPDQ